MLIPSRSCSTLPLLIIDHISSTSVTFKIVPSIFRICLSPEHGKISLPIICSICPLLHIYYQTMATPPPNRLSTISARALHLVNTLNLEYLPYESGYVGLLGSSALRITTTPGSNLAAQSHNYYMLTSALPINYLHWLEPDDTHILIEGGPVEYYIFHPATDSSLPKAERIVLGRDFEKGQTAIISVPGGCWKALRLCEGVDFALMGNVLSPEFTGDRVKIGFWNEEERKEWKGRYAGREEWVTEETLEELVGEVGC